MFIKIDFPGGYHAGNPKRIGCLLLATTIMLLGSLLLATTMLLVYLLETTLNLRTSELFDFTGTSFRARPYVAITSSFFHANLSHVTKQAFALLLVGPATETVLGTPLFVLAFVLCGALGCIVSWQSFRLFPPQHLRQISEQTLNCIVDGSPSRGGSACTYGLTAMAVLLASDAGVDLGGFFPWWVVCVVVGTFRMMPMSKKKWERCVGERSYLFILLLASVVGSTWLWWWRRGGDGDAFPVVCDVVIVWYAGNLVGFCMIKQREIALTDWYSHTAGCTVGVVFAILVLFLCGRMKERCTGVVHIGDGKGWRVILALALNLGNALLH